MNNKTTENNESFAEFFINYLELLAFHGVIPQQTDDGYTHEEMVTVLNATKDVMGLVTKMVNDEPGSVGNLADLADEDGVLSFTHEQKQALTNEVTGAFNKVGVECPHCIGMHLSGMAEMLLSTPMDDGVSDGHDVH